MSRWTFSLAGIPVHVETRGEVVDAHVAARFGAFSRCPWRDDLPPWTVLASADESWAPPRAVRSPLPGADVQTLDDGRLELLRFYDQTIIDPARRIVHSVARPSVATVPVIDPTVVDTPLRYVASLGLPAHEGILLHASGFADPRGAVVFLAVSGGGKTTTARKLPHEGVLSDDQVAVRRIGQQWVARALPFVGEYRRATVPCEGALRALVLLGKGEGASLQRLAPAEAIATVMRCAVNFVPGAHAGAILGLAADLVAAVPSHRLVLHRDAPMEPVLRELLGP